jgi:endonuclease/exonuclease/phosphatase family metal-dependent hydrolase
MIDKNTGRTFYFFNTHFDHQSQNARLESAKLIARRIAEREHDDPVVLAGDFNAGEDNPVIKQLKADGLIDTYRAIHPDANDVGTGNGGYTGRRDGAKIDYVFVTRDIETLGASIDQEPRDGRYPSDHYPVTATLRLPVHKQ